MNNLALVWLLWAIGLGLTLIGIEVIDTHSHYSLEELLGYVTVGLGLRAMISAGRAMND